MPGHAVSNGERGEAKQKMGKVGSGFDLGVSRLLAPRLLQTASRLCHHQQLLLHQQAMTTSRTRGGCC